MCTPTPCCREEEHRGQAGGTRAHAACFCPAFQSLPAQGSPESVGRGRSRADGCMGPQSSSAPLRDAFAGDTVGGWSWRMPVERWVRSLWLAEQRMPETGGRSPGVCTGCLPLMGGERGPTLTCQKPLGSKKSSWQLPSLLRDCEKVAAHSLFRPLPCRCSREQHIL